MRTRVLAGLALLAVAAALPFFPPFGEPWGRPDSALERLFPGVPAWWIVLRLGSLVGAAALLGLPQRSERAAPTIDAIATDGDPGETLPRAAAALALALAFTHLGLACFASALPRALQATYAILFLGPTMVLTIAGRRDLRAPSLRAAAAPMVLLLGTWVLAAAALGRGLRAASAVDLWFCWDCLASASRDGSNLLTEGPLPGLSAFHFVLQGVGLLPFDDLTATWPIVRGVQVAWMVVAALAIARGTRSFELGSPAVAAAALLCSPFSFLAVVMPCPVFLGNLLGALALACLAALWKRPGAAALAALGATAGLAATHPSLVPLAAACVVAAAVLLLRPDRPPISAVVTALASFLAAAIPAIPAAETVAQMASRYATGSTSYTAIQGVLLGQFSPMALRQATEAMGHRLEIFAAALVTPWLTSPTPIRLWGDALFDPLGAALAAVGLVVAVRNARTAAGPRVVLLLLAAALAPGVVSNFDRPSATRMMALGVPVALLAAIGARRLAELLASPGRRSVETKVRRMVETVVVVFVALGGTALFVRVTPSVVPASSLEILLEATREAGDSRLVMLDYVLKDGPDSPGRLDWFYFEETIAAVAPGRARVVTFRDDDALEGIRLGDGEVAGWSRAAEKDGSIGDAVCGRWPDATVWTLADRSGFSLAHLATGAEFTAPSSPRWTSALKRNCGDVQARK